MMMQTAGLNEREAKLDWMLITSLILLMLIGIAFVYSAAMVTEAAQDRPLWKQLHLRQVVYCLAGSSLAAGVCLIPYHILARWSLVAFAIIMFTLVLVLIPGIGYVQGGASRWFDLGFFHLQPSEFAKLAFILGFAHYLSRPLDELRLGGIFLKSLGMILLPVVLVLVEPDLGTALLFFPTGLVMMYVAGIPASTLKKLVAGCTVFVAVFLAYVLFVPPEYQKIGIQEYQRRRLLVYFNMDYPPKDHTEAAKAAARRAQRNDSYNVRQAMISVGSGGLTGKGYRQGNNVALGYLPRGVAHNDFIFSVIAEETGFIGSMVVVGLYTLVLFSGIRIAGQARDRLGKILAVGVVTLFFSQVFINIGMNIRIMPVTGVPLPLLTYGGSSALSSLIAAGLLLNVYLYRKAY